LQFHISETFYRPNFRKYTNSGYGKGGALDPHTRGAITSLNDTITTELLRHIVGLLSSNKERVRMRNSEKNLRRCVWINFKK